MNWSILSYVKNNEWVTEFFDNDDKGQLTETEFNDLKSYVETNISPVKTWAIGKHKTYGNLCVWFTLVNQPKFNKRNPK